MIQSGYDQNISKNYLIPWDKVIQAVGYFGLATIIILFLRSNLSYADKLFYIASRSPTSAACLRNYSTAPTYCEGYIFQWGVGNPSYVPEMGTILDKYNWSVLGPRQEWTLQGDYILGNVSLVSQTVQDKIRWVLPGSDEPSYWSDYHHLNVLLNPGQSILWQIDLPPNLTSAKFNTGLSLLHQTTCQEQNVSIRLESPSDSPKMVFQQKGLCQFSNEVQVNENLFAFSGERVVIRITNESDSGEGKAIRLHYPRILIDQSNMQREFKPPEIRPINTDLSSKFIPLKTSGPSPQIILSNPEIVDLQLQNISGLLIWNGPVPSVSFTPAQPVCMSTWSRFNFSLALIDNVARKKVGIGFDLDDNHGDSFDVNTDFPLLAGEDLHAYSLDMETLNLPDQFCITNVDFNFFDGTSIGSDQWVQINDVGFLPRTPLRFGFSP